MEGFLNEGLLFPCKHCFLGINNVPFVTVRLYPVLNGNRSQVKGVLKDCIPVHSLGSVGLSCVDTPLI